MENMQCSVWLVSFDWKSEHRLILNTSTCVIIKKNDFSNCELCGSNTGPPDDLTEVFLQSGALPTELSPLIFLKPFPPFRRP